MSHIFCFILMLPCNVEGIIGEASRLMCYGYIAIFFPGTIMVVCLVALLLCGYIF